MRDNNSHTMGSNPAKNLLDDLRGYLVAPGGDNTDAVKGDIEALDFHSMTTFIEGRPLLTAIARRMFGILSERDGESKRVSYLDVSNAFSYVLGRLLVKAYSLGAAADLLKQSDGDFTPLHIVLKDGSYECVKSFLDAIKAVFRPGCISFPEYVTLLTAISKSGVSTLNLALASSDSNVLRLYFDRVTEALFASDSKYSQYRDEALYPSYARFLINVDERGRAPMYEPLVKGNSDFLRCYLIALNKAYENKGISLSEYARALISLSPDGFSAMKLLLSLKNREILRVYLRAVRQVVFLAIRQGAFDREAYSRWLFGADRQDARQLNDTLRSCDRVCLEYYLHHLSESAKAGVIDSSKYLAWLIGSHNEGGSRLDYLLHSDNVLSLEVYLTHIQQSLVDGLIDRSSYVSWLMRCDNQGMAPLHRVFLSGHQATVNLYWSALDKAFVEESLTCYKRFLVAPNIRGLTPLHFAANSGSWIIYCAFRDRLEKVLSKQEMQEALFAKSQVRQDKPPVLPSCGSDDPRKLRGGALINADLSRLRKQYSCNNDIVQEPENSRRRDRGATEETESSVDTKLLSGENSASSNQAQNSNTVWSKTDSCRGDTEEMQQSTSLKPLNSAVSAVSAVSNGNDDSDDSGSVVLHCL